MVWGLVCEKAFVEATAGWRLIVERCLEFVGNGLTVRGACSIAGGPVKNGAWSMAFMVAGTTM